MLGNTLRSLTTPVYNLRVYLPMRIKILLLVKVAIPN